MRLKVHQVCVVKQTNMRKFTVTLLFVCIFSYANSQVLITNNILPGPPNFYSMLEVRSDVKGFLLPRTTTYFRNSYMPGSFVPNGLMYFDTDSSAVMIKTNAGWVRLLSNYSMGNIIFGDNTTTGSKLRWLADKSAFRVGYFDNTNWDPNYIGNYSAAFGHSNAIGDYSAGFGSLTLRGILVWQEVFLFHLVVIAWHLEHLFQLGIAVLPWEPLQLPDG